MLMCCPLLPPALAGVVAFWDVRRAKAKPGLGAVSLVERRLRGRLTLCGRHPRRFQDHLGTDRRRGLPRPWLIMPGVGATGLPGSGVWSEAAPLPLQQTWTDLPQAISWEPPSFRRVAPKRKAVAMVRPPARR